MASFNKVILMGNLTRDPETRVTPSGLTICKLGLAVSRTYSTKDGERKEETAFVDVDAFGRQAEVITKYMSKGKPIMLEGRLRFDQWESNDGQKRNKLSVVLENFQFVGGAREEGGSASGGSYESSSPPARETNPESRPAAPDSIDDDVPF
ncbi:MAG: single-stranded DNA-binding protein [Coraliomargarita sp. TMED73]|jgi:single-strand DNA-binding protein|nr:MAG: single-stranded DNA-binding protein [Coraliomargarita sp. TMED73]|tara:strand:+ start:1930 stop:2382 length:453 start_codon:yes stop_codon:yes gene_type:complete